jgi:tetratricopeptide (TPR) repeat protein
MDQRRPIGVAGTAALAVALLLLTQPAEAQAPASKAPPGTTVTQLRLDALNLAYNLDHDEAIALLRRAVELAPEDPAPRRTLASVLWLNMLFRRGAVTIDHYLGSLSRARIDLQKPDPAIDAEFLRQIERALALAEKRVTARPNDPQARYDLGAALGLHASYVATVEGRMLAGFKAARRSFDEHERVLQLDPARKDAGLIVGTYRYLVSTLSMPMRMMAYVAGFGGGRDRGIQLLKGTAAEGTDARVDAMFALILVYNRERRYDEALRVLQDLRNLYPRNRLLVLETGATALRAGRHQQADAVLSEGLAMLAGDRRSRIPGEQALWRYKRGVARAALGRTETAVADLRQATLSDAQPWVNGRARIELGRLALTRGDRASAAGEARQAETLCRNGNDPACVEDARRLLRNSDGR